MHRSLHSFLAAATVSLASIAATASAAVTLDQVTVDPARDPLVQGPSATFSIASGSLSFLTSTSAALVGTVGPVNVATNPLGQMSVFALLPPGPLLTGTFEDEEIGTDLVRVLYQTNGGALASDFGDYAVLSLFGSGFGGDGMFTATGLEIVGAELNVTPIPLPAGFMLLLGSLVGIVLASRARWGA